MFKVYQSIISLYSVAHSHTWTGHLHVRVLCPARSSFTRGKPGDTSIWTGSHTVQTAALAVWWSQERADRGLVGEWLGYSRSALLTMHHCLLMLKASKTNTWCIQKTQTAAAILLSESRIHNKDCSPKKQMTQPRISSSVYGVKSRLGTLRNRLTLLFQSQSNKALCSRSPLQPIERDQPVDFKGVATRSSQDTTVSYSAVLGLRHFTFSLWMCEPLPCSLVCAVSHYNDISEIKMDYGALLSCHSLGSYSTMSCYCYYNATSLSLPIGAAAQHFNLCLI